MIGAAMLIARGVSGVLGSILIYNYLRGGDEMDIAFACFFFFLGLVPTGNIDDSR
jgi:hypothetical protein